MTIETFKLNTSGAFLNKAQPLNFKNAPRSVAGVWPETGSISFVVDETATGVTCNAWVTTAGQPIQGSVIGQIWSNLFVTSDCFV